MLDRIWSQLRPRALQILLATLTTILLWPHPTLRSWSAELRRAQLAAAQSDTAAAAAALAQALELQPQPGQLWIHAVEAALAADDFELAVQLLERAPQTAADDMVCLRLQAQLGTAGPAQAIEAVLAAPPACSIPAATRTQLAQTALRAGNPQISASLLQPLTVTQPEYAAGWMALAEAQLLISDEQAAGSLAQAADLGTSSPLLQELLAAVSSAGSVGSVTYFKQIGQAFARHQAWPEAALAFEAALERQAGDWQAAAYLGVAQDRLGQDGLQQLQAAFARAPGQALTGSFLGLHWLEAGQPQRAQFFLRRAAELDPRNPAYPAQLAAAYAADGELQAARDAYEQAVELSGQSADFLYLAARFALDYELDVRDFGLPAARSAYLLAPTADHADAIGLAHYLLGAYHLADRLLQRAVVLDPDNARAHLHLGLCSLDLGQRSRAEIHLRQASELDPEGSSGRLAQRALDGLDSDG